MNLARASLRPLCIEGRAPRQKTFSLERPETELDAQGFDEGSISSSSSHTSPDLLDSEEVIGDESVD